MARQMKVKTRIYRWRITAFVAALAVLFSFLALSDFDRAVETALAEQIETQDLAQGEKDALQLEVARPIEREMAGGQAHYYKVRVEAGQYLRLVVDQRGVDLVVTLFDSERKKILEVDSPNGPRGPEPVSIISDRSDVFLLEVRTLEKDVIAGRYEVIITDLRTHTPQDRTRLVAERIFDEAVQLENSGQPESIKPALEKYLEAVEHFRAAGDTGREATTLHRSGLILNNLGEKQKAMEHYNRALPLSRAIGDRSLEATLLNNIGSIYYSLGELQKAIERHDQSLQLSRSIGDRGTEAFALHNMGVIYRTLGEKQKALESFDQALSVSQATGNRSVEATALGNLGGIYGSLGDMQKSLERFNRSLQISRQIGDRRIEATSLNDMGAIYYSLGDKQKAQEYYNQSHKLYRDIGDHIGAANAILGIAKTEADQGRLLEARSKIESALELTESFRMMAGGHRLRSSFFATAQRYYEFSISVLMLLHKLHPDQGYEAAALQTAERARARSLIESLAEARLDIRQGADPALLERERALRRQMSAKTERQMRLLNSPHTKEQAAAIAREIEALTTQYNEAEAEIRSKNPRYDALTRPQPLTTQEIQRQALDEGTLLLEYFLGFERSYLWVVSTGSVKSYELPKRADIEEASLLVKRLLIARGVREEGESQERRQARIAEAEARYWPEAARLSQMILGPAVAELSGKRLAIVPDGELQDVAFGALPAPQPSPDGGIKTTNSKASQSGDWMPLIVEHEIVSLPSASTLAILRKETAGRQPAAKSVAVLADPVFDKDDERLRLTATVMSRRKGGADINAPAGGNLSRSIEEVMGARGAVSRLPFSRSEADAILSVAAKESSLKALDFQASRATAMSAELGQYRIVHFATHGLLNKAHPELSGIVLSLVDRQGNPQDGFLQLHDIYNLNLPAELVVLSACQTGLGKSVRGEGLIGLTRGFMYAGSKRVVASLWSVQDLATAELMKRFYGAMLGEKRMRPAEALRTAQIDMWKQKRWQSPYYWGAFTLYGEW